VLQESQAEIQDTEAVCRKQHFIVLAQTQWTHVQRLSHENKEFSPYIPLQAGLQKQKAKRNPHVAACDFIGYLISLVLLGVKKCVQVENF
jgi:hypothetical protein